MCTVSTTGLNEAWLPFIGEERNVPRDRKYNSTVPTVGQLANNSSPTRTIFFPLIKKTEIYPDNSNSPLARTVFRFPSEFELPWFYWLLPAGIILGRNIFSKREPQNCNWSVIVYR